MTQLISVDIPANPAHTGVAFGATIYQLDGSTEATAFSVVGWYQSPPGSWHHPGLSLPDAGGVIAVGIAGTEYARQSVGAAPVAVTGFATPDNVTAAQTAITDAIGQLNNLSVADIMALSVEAGVSLQAALRIILAVVSGKYVANDKDNPTQLLFYAPDGTTLRMTFTLTDTSRTPA